MSTIVRPLPPRRAVWVVLAGCLVSSLVGCGATDIETEYGERAGSSVNGTGVFADMMKDAGFRVMTWKRFSPKLEHADVLVWFDSDFEPPSPAQRAFVERWLSHGDSRTLVYVGRDYDGEIEYWRQLEGLVPSDQWEESRRRYGRAKSKFEQERQATQKIPTRWFVAHSKGPRYRPQKLKGPWSTDIDPSKLNIEIQTQLKPPDANATATPAVAAPPVVTTTPPTISRGPGNRRTPPPPRQLTTQPDPLALDNRSTLEFTPLLQTERDDWLAMQLTEKTATYPYPPWRDGRILVLSNGSFLTNIGLVNEENRRLAARVIDACGSSGTVAFLEEGLDGLPVFDKELDEKPNGFELFRVWPLNFILVHLVVLGIVYCLAKFPIFGRPKQLAWSSSSDFGKHVAAVGELLEKTRDANYARRLLAQYHSLKAKESR